MNDRQEAGLVKRAVRNGWNVPASVKKKSVERLGEILDQPHDPNTHLEAIRVAAILDKVDLDAQKSPLTLHVHNRPTGELLDQLQSLLGGDQKLVQNLKSRLLPTVTPLDIVEP